MAGSWKGRRWMSSLMMMPSSTLVMGGMMMVRGI